MAAKKPAPPPVRPRVFAPTSGEVTPFTQRQIAEGAQRSSSQVKDRSGTPVDLKSGANVVNHGLGRKPRGITVTPTVLDAAWAYALTSSDDRQATITCAGSDQPGAFVEFF